MRRSSTNWRKKFRRRVAACAIGGSAALSSAACYAANAFDSASDPVYADGWQAGDNGGFGFTPWNFDAGYIFAGTNYMYANAGFKMIDDGLKGGTQFSNPFNDIGRSWVIGTSPGDDGAPHLGRGFSPLQINDTLKVVFDNPTRRQFFKGYFIRLNGGTGGFNGNICNSGAHSCSFPLGDPKPKMGWDRFEYFNNGEWTVDDAAHSGSGVFDTDTAAGGALFQVTRTGGDTYNLLIHQFGGGTDFTASRTFANAGVPVDWIEFVFFNPVSDTGSPPTEATDFYIRSMEITAGTPPQWKTDGNGSWGEASNWTSGVPDGPDAVANFLGVITAPRTVALNSDRTVSSISFDNSNRYTITAGSGGTLTIGQSAQPGSISVNSGSHVIAANVLLAGTTSIDIANNSALTLSGMLQIDFGQTAMKGGKGALIISGPQAHQPGAVLLISEGRVELNSNAGAPGNANLTISIGDQQPLVKLGASQDLAGLLIGFEEAGAQGVDLASTPSAFHSLSIHGGDLDSAKASLSAAINYARTHAGDGIFDSGLHANSGIGIAKLIDAQSNPFVFIRHTRIGDLNLDGSVTISDFIDLASHFNGPGTWQEGDLNGDGAVTISDFIDLASNFNTAYVGGSVPISAADQAALIAFAEAHGVSLVPEPGSWAIFLAGASLLRRRPRRSKL